jgi:uncharacterized membrane protein/chorismate mutase
VALSDEQFEHGKGSDVVNAPGVERLLALSDGVFAIAITLMVFQLAVPVVARPDDELAGKLWDLAPKILSYAISFLIVASYWVAHRRIFRIIKRGDAGLTTINLALLLAIAFQPFPTAVMGSYGNSPAAVMLFAASLAAAGLLTLALWLYAAVGHRLVSVSITRQQFIGQTLPAAIAPAVFLLSMGIAPFSPEAAKVSWLLILVVPLVLGLAFRRFGHFRMPGHGGHRSRSRHHHHSSLEGIRTEIDQIDAQLLHVLAQRQEMVRHAAGLRGQRGLPGTAPHQVDLVHEHVARYAREHGISEAFAHRLFDVILAETRRLEDEILVSPAEILAASQDDGDRR